MVTDCCKLVGNLELGLDDCIISINTSCNTEIINACVTTLLEGASTFSVSLSGYASSSVWQDCPARAGVSVNYTTKYDCENDIVHIISIGQGQSYKIGPIDVLGVSILNELSTTCISLSANSSSGPASLYNESEQINGYGLSYTGQPIRFSTNDFSSLKHNLGGKLGAEFNLNNFSIEAQPGQLPVASYTFMKAL